MHGLVNKSRNVFDTVVHGTDAVVSALRLQYVASRVAQGYRPAASGPAPSVSASASASQSDSSHFRVLSDGYVIPPYELTDEQRAAVEAAFATDPKALEMRNESPRFGPGETDQANTDDYVMTLLWCGGIAVAIGVLQFVLTLLYMCCRICVWRWCCKIQSDHEKPDFPGYLTFWSKYWPVIFLACFIGGACAFGVIGITYNDELSKTFSSTDQQHGIGPLALNVMTQMDSFLSDTLDIAAQTLAIIPDAVDKVSNISDWTDELSKGTTNLQNHASQVGSTYGNTAYVYNVSSPATYPSSPKLWFCVACSAIGTAATTMNNELATQVQPHFDDYKTVVNDVLDTFVNAVTPITDSLRDAQTAVQGASVGIFDSEHQDSVKDAAETMEGYDRKRNLAFLILFSLVFVAPFLALIGLVCKRAAPFKATFAVGPLYLLIIWILMGVHWVLGLWLGDSCVVLDTAIVDAASYLQASSGDLGSVINACLTDTDLVTALDLEDELNFTNIIKFPQPLSVEDIQLDFVLKGLEAMQNETNAMNETDFKDSSNNAFNQATMIEQHLTDMNNVPTSGGSTITYGRQKVVDCQAVMSTASDCYDSNYVEPQLSLIKNTLHPQAYDGIMSYRAINASLTQLRSEVASLKSETDALETNLTSIVSSVNFTEIIMDPVNANVARFHALTGSCYAITQAFGDFKNTFCDQVGLSVQFITLSLFIIGSSCLGVTWCSRWSSYRVGFKPRVAPAPDPFADGSWMMTQQHQQQQQQVQAQAGGGWVEMATNTTSGVNANASAPGPAPVASRVASMDAYGVQVAGWQEHDPYAAQQQQQQQQPAYVPPPQGQASAPPHPESEPQPVANLPVPSYAEALAAYNQEADQYQYQQQQQQQQQQEQIADSSDVDQQALLKPQPDMPTSSDHESAEPEPPAMSVEQSPEQSQSPQDDDAQVAPADNDNDNDSGAVYVAASAMPVAPSADLASPSNAAGDNGDDDADDGTQGRALCESCETSPVAIHCSECEESLCVKCDQLLHKAEVNAGHVRKPI